MEVETVELAVARCRHCKRVQLPSRRVCLACGATELDPDRLAPDGRVFSFTRIRVPPARLREQAPYVVVVVEMAEGFRIAGRLDTPDPEAPLAAGDAVRLSRVEDSTYWFARA